MAVEEPWEQEDRPPGAARPQPAAPMAGAARRLAPPVRPTRGALAAAPSQAPVEWAQAAKEAPLAPREDEAARPAAPERQGAGAHEAEPEDAAGPALPGRV